MQTGILLWEITLFCVIVFEFIVIMVPKLIDKLLFIKSSDNTYEYSEAADLGFKSNIALLLPADKSHMTFSVNKLMKK